MTASKRNWKDSTHAFVNGEHGGCMVCGYGIWEPFHKVGLNDSQKEHAFTRQQVEAMLHIALTVRTDEWTSNSVDERVAALLAMFTKEKP